MAKKSESSAPEFTREEISRRAHDIWEREGRPEGRAMEHWLQAEASLRDVSGESAASGDGQSTTARPRRVPARATTPSSRREKRFEVAL